MGCFDYNDYSQNKLAVNFNSLVDIVVEITLL